MPLQDTDPTPSFGGFGLNEHWKCPLDLLDHIPASLVLHNRPVAYLVGVAVARAASLNGRPMQSPRQQVVGGPEGAAPWGGRTGASRRDA